MNVQLITPNSVVLHGDYVKINAEGKHGNFTVLPRHADYLAPLVPGILTLTDELETLHFFASDFGIFVKQADQVRITVRRAFGGDDLEKLQAVVSERFRKLDAAERASVAAVANLEASFVRRLLDMQPEGDA